MFKDKLIAKKSSVNNSQFAQPLFEFSVSCGGPSYLNCILIFQLQVQHQVEKKYQNLVLSGKMTTFVLSNEKI